MSIKINQHRGYMHLASGLTLLLHSSTPPLLHSTQVPTLALPGPKAKVTGLFHQRVSVKDDLLCESSLQHLILAPPSRRPLLFSPLHVRDEPYELVAHTTVLVSMQRSVQ